MKSASPTGSKKIECKRAGPTGLFLLLRRGAFVALPQMVPGRLTQAEPFFPPARAVGIMLNTAQTKRRNVRIMAPLTTKLTVFALILGVCTPIAGMAQTTDAPAADTTVAPATDAPKPAPGVGDDLSLGVTEGAGTGIGSSYTVASFEAWEQRCIRSESGADPCQLYQLLKDETGNSVAEIAIFGLPAGTKGPAVAGANIVVPLETLLTEGVSVRVDEGKGKTYPFSVCSGQGCIARVGLTAEELDGMRKGAGGIVSIVPFIAPDQRVELTLSLKGFTAGYTATEEMNAKADAAAAAADAAAAAANKE